MKAFDFIVIDCETTGLDEKRNEITELGIIRFRNGEVVEEFASLLKPKQKISDYVVKMTGITNAMVQAAPRFQDKVEEILAFIGNDLVIGHNVAFDLGMLNAALARENREPVQNASVDTLDLVSLLMPTMRSYKLSQLAKALDIENGTAHRAKDDALMTGQLYLRCLQLLQALDPEILQILYTHIVKSKWAFKHVLKHLFHDQMIPEDLPWVTYLFKKVGLQLDSDQPRKVHKEFQSVDLEQIFSYFKKEGILSKKMKSFELRSPQLEMLEAVWLSLTENTHQVIEAGTGTGKSFAYLLPSMLFALKTGQPVIISTKTKALQDQLFDKDIPWLKKHLEIPVETVMIKGRANYLCLNKFAFIFSQAVASAQDKGNLRGLLSIMMWMFQTDQGDFSEVHNSLVTKYKNQISADGVSCLQNACPMRQVCFLQRLRRQAKQADLLVVNHALLLSDAQYGRKIIPNYAHLIVDEAHALEDVATSIFSKRLNRRHLHEIAVKTAEKQILSDLLFDNDQELPKKIKEARRIGRKLMKMNNDFFAYLEDTFRQLEKHNMFFKKSQKRIGFDQIPDESKSEIDATLHGLAELVSEIDGLLQDIVKAVRENADIIKRSFLRTLVIETQVSLEVLKLLSTENDDSVRWVEKIELRRSQVFEVYKTPIYVGDILVKEVFKDLDSTLFTSATISIQEDFSYFLSRIGYLESDLKIDTLYLPSPFNLEKNILLCAPQDVPLYNDGKQYVEKLSVYIQKLLISLGGRALVLFTSHKHLSEVFHNIREGLEHAGIHVYCQGKRMSDKNLIKSFHDDVRSVLMGTESFWEGIDVPGKSLSHVIVVKLPFEVPTDPIVSSRMEQVAKSGRSSFFDYAVPHAIVKLKQGTGRLIRTKNDKGSVIILDRRVLKQGYGKRFINAIIASKSFPRDRDQLQQQISQWLE